MTDYVYTSGGFPSSPTSGDSLVINGAYYDWTGGAWKIRNATPLRSEFIATANQATKTGLTYFVGSIDCYINGAKMLLGTDFTATDGTSVTFTPALDLDDEVQLIMGVSASSAAGASSLASLSDTTVATTDPLITSNPSAVGHVWVNSTTGQAYVCNDITTDLNAWINVGAGTESVLGYPVVTGGTESTYTSGGVNYKTHTFTSSGTLTVTGAGDIEYLVVAGGGAGGNAMGGGGGAGGLIHNIGGAGLALSPQAYTIVIGTGGAGTASNVTVNGSDTTAFSLTAIGGGGASSLAMQRDAAINDGAAGGSGGGSGASDSSGNGSGGAALQPSSASGGYGNAGGNQTTAGALYYPGAGGGGAGAAGQTPATNTSNGGNGGAGMQVNIDGNNYYYAGGGGGDGYSGCPVAGGGGSWWWFCSQ